jgi:acetyl-CoA carboxylase carboxyl transferase subunit alpha
MHGDRRFGDDKAIVAGVAMLGDTPVTVIAIEKGRDVKDKARRNFGSAHPEGYRKALRQMKLAEKFHRPVVCFIDTSGAYPGIEAEERGQAQAIAENLYEMMTLKTPIISIVIGEGGSGGALALAVADEIWMLENSVFSVISPEGCASILWKDAGKVKEASSCLKLTAEDLKSLGVIEKVFPEDRAMFKNLKSNLLTVIGKNTALGTDALLKNRYHRFRRVGIFSD